MKKGMILSATLAVVGLDAGFVLEHDAGDDHDHNASNHSPNGSPATGSRVADDDNNDAHGRRLLIAKAGRGCVCRRHGPVGRLRISKSSTEFDRSQAGGYSRDCAQDS